LNTEVYLCTIKFYTIKKIYTKENKEYRYNKERKNIIKKNHNYINHSFQHFVHDQNKNFYKYTMVNIIIM